MILVLNNSIHLNKTMAELLRLHFPAIAQKGKAKYKNEKFVSKNNTIVSRYNNSEYLK